MIGSAAFIRACVNVYIYIYKHIVCERARKFARKCMGCSLSLALHMSMSIQWPLHRAILYARGAEPLKNSLEIT